MTMSYDIAIEKLNDELQRTIDVLLAVRDAEETPLAHRAAACRTLLDHHTRLLDHRDRQRAAAKEEGGE